MFHEKQTDVSIRLDLLWTVREILRNALQTMTALRDPDRKYLGWKQPPTIAVYSAAEAYGYAEASVKAFTPTPHEIAQAERVGPWLAWLRRTDGDEAIKRMIAWSVGVPTWRIAQREGCSERQVMRRIDRSVALIIAQFTGADIPVEQIEEPPVNGVTFAVIFERADATSNATQFRPMKIYIGGRGMWKNGRWLRDGQHRAEKFV